MIISASRRTDIPAFFSEWFFSRIREGYVLVRNPMNFHQVSRITLHRDMVDCIVFWTKNPQSMLSKLSLIKSYPYYFQFTLNPYDTTLEKVVPGKAEVINTFKKLSEEIGPQRVIWRYDPIIINSRIDTGYHEKYFEVLAKKLQGYASKCIISFIDIYKKTDKAFQQNGIQEIDNETKRSLAQKISLIAAGYGLKIETCAEEIDLDAMGIGHARCIDPDLIELISGGKIKSEKDRNQRKACGCVASVDIGTYHTCSHGCVYCYANVSREVVKRNITNYDTDAPLLCGKLTELDRVIDRNCR